MVQTKKMEKILIVEKETSYEYNLRKFIQGMPCNGNSEDTILKNSDMKEHNEHLKVKDLVLDTLFQLGIETEIIKDLELSNLNKIKYGKILTLGGDRTFLRTGKYLSDELLIGINSTFGVNSRGALLELNKHNFKAGIEQVLNDNYEIKKMQRLQAYVNDKKLPYLAINEIGIKPIDSEEDTGRYDLENSITNLNYQNVLADGLIISTSQGSTAYFKNAGGTSFSNNGVGYAFLVPDRKKLKELQLESTGIFNGDTIFQIGIKRQQYKIIFDCDKKRRHLINQGDEIKIGIDFDNPLNLFKYIK